LELVEEPPPELDLHVFRYIANSIDNFCPAQTVHKATPLWKKDIPPAQFELRMSERRQPTAEDFIWAYACISDDPSFQAVELAQFGAKHASIAIAMWKEGPVADLAVETDKSCQRMGYGLTAVSAITKWILKQGEIAVYGAHAGNVPSLRIARRLGFTPLLQEMGL